MLDAYIIDRIRREKEKESRDGAFVPLHKEAPQPPESRPPSPSNEAPERPERGSVIIDFHL